MFLVFYVLKRSKFTQESHIFSSFVEMPSVNWREAADNWFGGCCCSFGGISEKLVSKYANSFSCIPGTCLLDDTSVTICKDDLSASVFQDSTCDTPLVATLNSLSLFEKSNCLKLGEEEVEEPSLKNGLSGSEHSISTVDHDHCCFHNSETSSFDNDLSQCGSFKQGPLGSSFIINSSDLCSDIQWVEFVCSQCSCPLGSYPSAKDVPTPSDGGVRFFKCYLSTSLPAGGSDDIFRSININFIF